MSKEITIYELLGLIKDGKAPNRILYDHYIWSWTGDDYHTILKTEKEQYLITGMYYTWVSKFLNDKVEIIEEKDKEIERLNNIINKTRRILGQYAHYSTPTEEQNAKNEAIVDEAYIQLHGNLAKELKEGNK